MSPKKMRIITVSGAQSNVGKTALIESLLSKLKGWSCLKVTVLHMGNCPVKGRGPHGTLRPVGKTCSGCNDLDTRFSIVQDKRIIGEKGKDTQRFKAAGAKEVIWLRVKREGLRQGLKKTIAKFGEAKGLIIEGTSVLKYLNPDLAIFVTRKNSLLKDSAKEALKKIDLILVL